MPVLKSLEVTVPRCELRLTLGNVTNTDLDREDLARVHPASSTLRVLPWITCGVGCCVGVRRR